jgi:uracil phosphoribosyltransferase
MPVHVSTHPLMLHKLARLRDRDTEPKRFRELVEEMSKLLFIEASESLRTKRIEVQTPLSPCPSDVLSDRVGVVPILRAGLGMADAILQLYPEATVWHLGLYRDHTTHQPIWYYDKLPEIPNIDVAFVVDPMLATGGSVIAAIDRLKKWGVKEIIFLGLIAAPEGVHLMEQAHPKVPIYLAALDSHLTSNKYIVPGLGDAGDRQFGTT